MQEFDQEMFYIALKITFYHIIKIKLVNNPWCIIVFNQRQIRNALFLSLAATCGHVTLVMIERSAAFPMWLEGQIVFCNLGSDDNGSTLNVVK